MYANDAEDDGDVVVMGSEEFGIVEQGAVEGSELEPWAAEQDYGTGEDEISIAELSSTSQMARESDAAPPDTKTMAPRRVPTGPRALMAHLAARPYRPSERVASHQWLSAKELEIDKFLSAKMAIKKIAPQSPFVPPTLHEWLTHRLELLEDRKQSALVKLSRISQENLPGKCERAFGGKSFSDNRSAVLALETIWIPWTSPDRPVAPWPTIGEYKWEGDARARSGFRRFPPIPRAVGNDTVVWHQKPAADVYEFDRVGLSACVPYWESTSLMREDLLLNEDLWSSID
ncbi:hypothetical protein GP486_003855 [Trichoglossum hirsutum]|uniref:Uncharacterized protein n=1 Tax=Trichoglossum hirsutum TaxID=265104 RepID=A0A9P8LC95_9PEZI|nr:hypothetical protein GP486_003855 [Trichoglossum hirsutum]